MRHLHHLMKWHHSVNAEELESRASAALRALLQHVPAIDVIDMPPREGDTSRFDFAFQVRTAVGSTQLLCEVKSSGQPSRVKAALLHLRHALEGVSGNTQL